MASPSMRAALGVGVGRGSIPVPPCSHIAIASESRRSREHGQKRSRLCSPGRAALERPGEQHGSAAAIPIDSATTGALEISQPVGDTSPHRDKARRPNSCKQMGNSARGVVGAHTCVSTRKAQAAHLPAKGAHVGDNRRRASHQIVLSQYATTRAVASTWRACPMMATHPHTRRSRPRGQQAPGRS